MCECSSDKTLVVSCMIATKNGNRHWTRHCHGGGSIVGEVDSGTFTGLDGRTCMGPNSGTVTGVDSGTVTGTDSGTATGTAALLRGGRRQRRRSERWM